MQVQTEKNSKRILATLILFFAPLLLTLKTSTLFGGDAGDLVTAAYVHGVAHPPGYPLYTFIAWLLTLLPFDTVSGRVSLLSVIPGIFSLIFTYLIAQRISKNNMVAWLSAGIYGSTYLFLLLSIVPEVFSLHLLFVTLITFLLILFRDTGDKKWWYSACFVFGLSLTHHHTILFVLPAWGYLIYAAGPAARFPPRTPTRGPLLGGPPPRVTRSLSYFSSKYTKYYILNTIYCILLGLLPYSYVYFAAKTHPVINWENPQTLNGFVRLITRAIYGTFRSGNMVGLSLSERWYHVVLFFETLWFDFTKLGVFLGIIGSVYLFFKKRFWFTFLLLGFVSSGPLFLFYASFPQGNNFYLGTAERFYLVPYFFWSLLIGCGVVAAKEIFLTFFFHIIPRWRISSTSEVEKFNILYSLFYILFFLYPALLLLTTLPKILPLRTDTTSEKMADDVYRTVTPGSLLIMTEDTRLFAVQYKYFTENKNQPFILIHFGFLGYPFYFNDAKARYPGVFFPDEKDPGLLSQRFILDNATTYTIFADYPYPVTDEYRWIPVGILYQLYRVDAEFSDEEYHRRNQQLFDQYQDPLDGALGRYKHLMLADILRVYGNSWREVGKAFSKLGFNQDADRYFDQAIKLQPEISENSREKISNLIIMQKCDEARAVLSDIEVWFPRDPYVYETGAELFRTCFNDEKKASEYEQKRESLRAPYTPQLQDL